MAIHAWKAIAASVGIAKITLIAALVYLSRGDSAFAIACFGLFGIGSYAAWHMTYGQTSQFKSVDPTALVGAEESGGYDMRVLGAFFAFMAMLANIATIAVLVRIYWFGETLFTFTGSGATFQYPYTTLALVGLPVLAFLNVFSARYRPDNAFFRWWVDFLPSVALLIVALTVLILAVATDLRPPQGFDALLFFTGTAIWSLVDVFYYQYLNTDAALTGRAFERSAAPADLADPRIRTQVANGAAGGAPPHPSERETEMIHRINRRYQITDIYERVLPDGSVVPMNSPDPWLIQHIDLHDYHWVDDPPRELEAPAREPEQNGTPGPTPPQTPH